MTLSANTQSATPIDQSARGYCRGTIPLDAILEPWMADHLQSQELHKQIAQFGSPLNLIDVRPMVGNVDALNRVAAERDLDFQAFFARKANKCLRVVDQAIALGIGIDTASENEVQQCLDRGVEPIDMICTAAVKTESLVQLCVARKICIAVDNHDELNLIRTVATLQNRRAKIALRLGGFAHQGQKLVTRFGFDVDRDRDLVGELSTLNVSVQGLHFHLDGYEASQRASAIMEAAEWIERLRSVGQQPTFIDMGGGFPVSYLQDAQQYATFWRQHELALLTQRSPITVGNHALGRTMAVRQDAVVGSPQTDVMDAPNVYPMHQGVKRTKWFSSVLDAPIGSGSVASRLINLGVQLRCEPGRSLMDGCGITVARVEFRKQNAAGDWLIGLSMNRTQCRTSHDDFLLDPLLLPADLASSAGRSCEPMSGYLVGTYCMEQEWLSLRRFEFPFGVRRGDLVVFPNTAGYLMHFMESRSHQFALAKNLVRSSDVFSLDPIDTL